MTEPDDDRVGRLFTLLPEDFVAERDALVKQLRADGRRSRAQEVAGLRRPTLAAWAVNQAVRSDPSGYEELLAAGEQMRQQLRRAMSGLGGADVAAAAQHRRARVDAMAQTALAHLSDGGHDAGAHAEAVAATFDAASASEQAAAQVGGARLVRPLARPSEFEALSPLELVGTGDLDEATDGAGADGAGANGAGAHGAGAHGAGTDEADDTSRGARGPSDHAAREAALAAQVTAARTRLEEAEAAAAQTRRAAREADAAADEAEQEAATARDRMEGARRAFEQAAERAEFLRRAADRARDEAQRAETTRDRRADDLARLR